MRTAPFIILLLLITDCFARNDPWWVGNDLFGHPCIDVDEAQYGPFDYTKTEDKPRLPIVEEYHFSKETEALLNDNEGHSPAGAINYTISAFPNHHRALISITNYQILFDNGVKKEPLKTRAECYFQRAINFSKEDGISYLLFAKYLTKKQKHDMAVIYYKKAEALLPNNPVLHYNYGLSLYKLKNFEDAKHHAELAKKYGHPGNKLLKLLENIK